MYSAEISTPAGIPSKIPTNALPCDSPAVRYRIIDVLFDNYFMMEIKIGTICFSYSIKRNFEGDSIGGEIKSATGLSSRAFFITRKEDMPII
jgi:hypothetical protein